MLFNHYSKKEVKTILSKVVGEYKDKIASQQTRINELIQKNRELSAKVSEYEGKESQISSAIIGSVEAGKRIEERSEAYVKNQLKGLRLLSDRCRALAAEIKEKYPEADDCAEFSSFFDRLDEVLGEENGFDYELAFPAEKDLETLCRELGVEDDGEENKEFVIFDDEETDEKNTDY